MCTSVYSTELFWTKDGLMVDIHTEYDWKRLYNTDGFAFVALHVGFAFVARQVGQCESDRTIVANATPPGPLSARFLWWYCSGLRVRSI